MDVIYMYLFKCRMRKKMHSVFVRGQGHTHVVLMSLNVNRNFVCSHQREPLTIGLHLSMARALHTLDVYEIHYYIIRACCVSIHSLVYFVTQLCYTIQKSINSLPSPSETRTRKHRLPMLHHFPFLPLFLSSPHCLYTKP